jgi:anti-sigma B factor antagonist
MRIRSIPGDGEHLIELAGRFDAQEVPEFRSAVEALLRPPAPVLRVDLANVVFVDSSALAELLRAHKTAKAAGGGVVLRNVSDPVRVILEITALTSVFTMEKTEALGAATP